MQSFDLDTPIVSCLGDGESLTIYEMVEGKPHEPPRNKITYTRVGDFFIRIHTNYFGHIEEYEVTGEDADYECNGLLEFEGWRKR